MIKKIKFTMYSDLIRYSLFIEPECQEIIIESIDNCELESSNDCELQFLWYNHGIAIYCDKGNYTIRKNGVDIYEYPKGYVV
jgi:hypothetical protein